MRSFQKFVLENGIRLIVAPVADCHEVGIWVFIKSGSQYEKKSENGVNHFIDHLVLRGTQKWPTHRLITEKFEDIAIDHDAQTDLEEVSYSIYVPARHFVTALDLCSDLVCRPLLGSEDIEKEKGFIPREIRECLDTPMKYVKEDLWYKTCFGNQPAGRPVYGAEEIIAGFTEDKIRRFFEKRYVGRAIIISVTGGIETEFVLEKVKKFFGQIKPGESEDPLPVRDYQRHPRIGLLSKDTAETHFALGFKTPFRAGNPEEHAIKVLAEILHFNVFNTLVGEQGIAYRPETWYSRDSTKSFLCTYAGVAHERLTEAILFVLREYKKVLAGKITVQDVEREVGAVVRKTKKDLSENPSALAEFYGRQELHVSKIISAKEEIRRYRMLRLRDILKVARKSIRLEYLNLAIVGPNPDQEKLEKLLREF